MDQRNEKERDIEREREGEIGRIETERKGA